MVSSSPEAAIIVPWSFSGTARRDTILIEWKFDSKAGAGAVAGGGGSGSVCQHFELVGLRSTREDEDPEIEK